METKRHRGDYVNGDCPGCGRRRLMVVIEPIDGGEYEKAVGIRCEKCSRQWRLDPDAAEWWGDEDDRNPIHTLPEDDNHPFGEAGTQ